MLDRCGGISPLAMSALSGRGVLHCSGACHDYNRRHDPNDEYLALTDDEVAKASDNFVESLLPEKIKALASRYNGGRSCDITGQARGSYNVCFFVKFDNDEEWVVRIPIEPALYKPWETLLSEVATIE